jgi:hypothetical protein
VTTLEELADEARRARKVRHLVDLATGLITQSGMSRDEAEKLVAVVRAQILSLFPGREQTFEVVYALRFRRLIDEYTQATPDGPAALLPFAPRRT